MKELHHATHTSLHGFNSMQMMLMHVSTCILRLHNTVFVDREKKWAKRRRGGDRVISRMYSVSPTDPEKFVLRLLLLHVQEAKSYEDLRTVDGELCEIFRTACIQLHLLADDTEYANAMHEASQFRCHESSEACLPPCAYCQLSDPVSLWNNYEEAMIEDLYRNNPHEAAVNLVLREIDLFYERMVPVVALLASHHQKKSLMKI